MLDKRQFPICWQKIKMARKAKQAQHRFHGNIVSVKEMFVQEYEKTGNIVELGSDQTSCHNSVQRRLLPCGLWLRRGSSVSRRTPALKDQGGSVAEKACGRNNKAVGRRHVFLRLWKMLSSNLGELAQMSASLAAKLSSNATFRYPSYVQDIMGDIYSPWGFVPLEMGLYVRKPQDLETTDKLAAEVLQGIVDSGIPEEIEQQYQDNLKWIREAGKHKMVVGSSGCICTPTRKGRRQRWRSGFNQAISRARYQELSY